MIRLSARIASVRRSSVVALVLFSMPFIEAAAQQQVPAAPPSPKLIQPVAPAPAAPVPAATAPVFPKPDPANFTAAAPTKETVNAFLQASWGFDDSRVWQVQAILKTPVEGVSKVIIYEGDKSGKQKPAAIGFFVLPDGKHIIAGDEIISFGEHPYADNRVLLEQKADGPYRGSAAKDLEIVEFADFQCPHCKEAQANIFPKRALSLRTFPWSSIPRRPKRQTMGFVSPSWGAAPPFTNSRLLFLTARTDWPARMAPL